MSATIASLLFEITINAPKYEYLTKINLNQYKECIESHTSLISRTIASKASCSLSTLVHHLKEFWLATKLSTQQKNMHYF